MSKRFNYVQVTKRCKLHEIDFAFHILNKQKLHPYIVKYQNGYAVMRPPLPNDPPDIIESRSNPFTRGDDGIYKPS